VGRAKKSEIADITITGYINTVLVLDMARFVSDRDRPMFQRLRATEELLQVLRGSWLEQLRESQDFEQLHHTERDNSSEHMSMNDVCFNTGIFQYRVIRYYVTPTYALKNKEQFRFSERIRKIPNLEYLLAQILAKWNVHIRPTSTGFITICFQRDYNDKNAIKVKEYVERLRYPYNIPHAIKTSGFDEQDIDAAIIDLWGEDPGFYGKPKYIPLHWILTQEICQHLIEVIKSTIEIQGAKILLERPQGRKAIPVDIYTIYHVDRILIPPPLARIMKGISSNDYRNTAPKNSKVIVSPQLINQSLALKQYFTDLMVGLFHSKNLISESAELGQTKLVGEGRPKSRSDQSQYNEATINNIFKQNLSDLSDELCLFTADSSLIVPSDKAINRNFQISGIASSGVGYQWYWQGIERMLEFVLEAHALARILRRESEKLLEEIESGNRKLRSSWSQELLNELDEKINDVFSLNRILSEARFLTTSSLWSRHKLSVIKAEAFFDKLDTDKLMHHAERNINTLNEALSHIDKLKAGEKTNNLSIVFGIFSILSLVINIISFWQSPHLTIIKILQEGNGWILKSISLIVEVLTLIGMLTLIGCIVWFVYMSLASQPFSHTVRKLLRRFRSFLFN
jgi:uncharacterized membrane protein YqjE